MRNIIIASNNQELHHLLSSFLAQAGYSHVYSSTDSKETFSLTYRYNPKLIIIDLELPSCELEDIFKFLSGPQHRIVLFVAPHREVDETILGLIKKGYTRFVIHPIDRKLFLREVEEIINLNK